MQVELQAYVEKMIPSLPPLADLEPSFQAQYVRIAVRKLLFFNDPHRLGKVKIGDLLVSTASWCSLFVAFVVISHVGNR